MDKEGVIKLIQFKKHLNQDPIQNEQIKGDVIRTFEKLKENVKCLKITTSHEMKFVYGVIKMEEEKENHVIHVWDFESGEAVGFLQGTV